MQRQLILLLAILSGGATVAVGQPDTPGHGVARISVLNGDVSVRRGDSGDFLAAAINAPLVVQDRLVTSSASRAEVQFDYSNMVRLAANSEIRFAELEYKRYIVQVARGTVTFRVLRDEDADVEISTPNVSVRPIRRGSYRVTVQEDGTSEITVRSGEADIYTPRGSERLRSGKTMLARGTEADPEFQIVGELRHDDWDQWNERRDRDLERSRSYTYVSRDIYGAEDLDDHGRWISTPEYGYVWAPRVALDWAPYRYGRWIWVDWYGWTWVSYDPWGWAPYHYGRWYHHASYGWCWAPGAFYGRHYWSPALVAFFGFGGVGVGFGSGNIGWVPLGPREPLYPWWGSRFYNGYRGGGPINSVRIVNNIQITNVYRNARVQNGVTIIDHDGFARGRGGSAARFTGAAFRDAGVVQGHLPVVPIRDSMRFADREARTPPVQGREADRFYSHRTPAPVDRIPFEQQRRSLEQVAHSGRSDRGGNALLPGSDTSPAPQPVDSGRGWRRTGEALGPAGVTAPAQNSLPGRIIEPRGADEGGWRRFGSARRSEPRAGAEQPARFGNAAVVEPQSGSRGSEITAPPGIRGGEGIREPGSANWQRFGSTSAPDRPSADSRGQTGGVTGSPAPDNSQTWRRNPGPRTETPRTDFGRAGSMRFETPSRTERGGGEPVRISPPIVRERATPEAGPRGGVVSGPRGSGQSSGSTHSGGGSASPRGAAPQGGSRGSGERGGRSR